jgi:phenylalanine-4-hydroxylase
MGKGAGFCVSEEKTARAARASSAGRRTLTHHHHHHPFQKNTDTPTDEPPHPIPASIADVDNGSILGFGPDLAPDHPGFGDAAYAGRRAAIAAAARSHVAGSPPPIVPYTPAETAVWAEVLTKLSHLAPQSACAEYLAAAPRLGFSPTSIPQLADVAATLHASGSRWSIRPVAGLMHPRDFLAGLAFRTFHSTQYVRHASRPDYTPEPDVCHELIGHVPMLLDPDYGDMVAAMGVASLGAPDAAVWRLTRVYWHTVEFGVVLEGASKTPKAFGAGILSSPGELAHFASGVATLTPLDPFAKLPRMAYKDGYQQEYFTLPSFAEGAELLRAYAAETTPADVRARFGLVGLGAGRLVPEGAGSGSGPVSPSVAEQQPVSSVVPAPGVAGVATPVADGEAAGVGGGGSA